MELVRYANGKVPQSALVQINGEPYHWTSPKGLAVWNALVRYVKDKHGVTLRITPGKNAYRDLDGQAFARKNACAAGNCNSAAVPGTSSHGGTWYDWRTRKTIDAMAFDVSNWGDIGQTKFYAACRAVGLTPGLITVAAAGHEEPWHVVLEDPWGPVPKFEEGYDMANATDVYKKFWAGQPVDSKRHYLWLNKAHDTSVASGPCLVWGALYVSVDLSKRVPGEAIQVESFVETWDGKKTTASSGLGIHEIIPTLGKTMAQIPVPPVALKSGQRLRFRIAATGGMAGKLSNAIFRGARVKA